MKTGKATGLLIIGAFLSAQIVMAGDHDDSWTSRAGKIGWEICSVSYDFVRTLLPFGPPLLVLAGAGSLPTAGAWCACHWEDDFHSCENQLTYCNGMLANLRQAGTQVCLATKGCAAEITDPVRVAAALRFIAPNVTFSPDQVQELTAYFRFELQNGNCSVPNSTCSTGVFDTPAPAPSESGSIIAPASVITIFGILVWSYIDYPQYLSDHLKGFFHMLGSVAKAVLDLEKPNQEEKED